MSISLIDRILAHRPAQKLGLLAVLGLAVHLLLPQIASLEHSWQVLRSMVMWAVALAWIAQALSYLGSGYLLQQIIKIFNRRVTLLRSTMIVLGAASVGMVAGGMVGSSAAIYRWTSVESQDSANSAILASLLPALFNNLILVLLSIIGLTHLILVHDLSSAQIVGFGAMLLFLAVVLGAAALAVRNQEQAAYTALWFSARLARLRHKTDDRSAIQAAINNLFWAWDEMRSGAWRPLALGAVLNVAFDILTLYFLFIAAGYPANPELVLTGYGLPLLLGKMAFVLPGGVGVVEGSMAALYNGLGVPSAITVVVVLAYRMISFWFPSLLGFPLAVILQKQTVRPSMV